MERLTQANHSGGYFYPICFERCEGTPGDCQSCEVEQRIIQRLGEYEDAGLEPREIEDMASVREITAREEAEAALKERE